MTDSPRAPEAPGGNAHRRPILIALMVTMALSVVDNTIMSNALPQVVHDLGGFTLFSWVFSGYLLAQTVSIPIYGKLADQWGRKPILIFGTVLFLTGSALSAASWDMVSLICFRALQGVGAGAIMATVNTLAGDLYELKDRGRVQGWLASVWGISAVFGPTLGGPLAMYNYWRWIFLINLPLGAVAIAMIARFLHEQVTRTRHRIDVAGTVAVLVAAGALVFGLLQGGVAWAWLSPQSIAVFAVSVVATVAALVAERRAAEPILPPWLWRQRAVAGSALAAFGLGLLVIGPTTFLPTYGQLVLGLSAVAAGAVLATISFGWPLATSQSAKLFLRLGFRDLPGGGRRVPAVPARVAGVAAGRRHVRARRRVRTALGVHGGGPAVHGGVESARRGHRLGHVLPVPRAERWCRGVRRDLQHQPQRDAPWRAWRPEGASAAHGKRGQRHHRPGQQARPRRQLPARRHLGGHAPRLRRPGRGQCAHDRGDHGDSAADAVRGPGPGRGRPRVRGPAALVAGRTTGPGAPRGCCPPGRRTRRCTGRPPG